MPTIDLSAIYDQVMPWDLTLTLDGHDLRVKRLNAIDIAKLQRSTAVSDEDARAVILALFEDEQEVAVADWDAEKIAIVVHAITEYYGEMIVKKKLASVREAVANLSERPRRR